MRRVWGALRRSPKPTWLALWLRATEPPSTVPIVSMSAFSMYSYAAEEDLLAENSLRSHSSRVLYIRSASFCLLLSLRWLRSTSVVLNVLLVLEVPASLGVILPSAMYCCISCLCASGTCLKGMPLVSMYRPLLSILMVRRRIGEFTRCFRGGSCKSHEVWLFLLSKIGV